MPDRADSFARPQTAVLTADYGSAASYYDDWRDAFETSRHFATTVFDIVRGPARRELARRIAEFDLIVLLHSVVADSRAYAERIRGTLGSRRGKLVAFVGNELNLPAAPMAPKIEFLQAIRPDIVATQLLEEAGTYLYGGTGARVVSVPHALNPAAFRPEVRLEDRHIDIGGRSFRYQPHIGDDDRNRLYRFFAEHAFQPDLRVDLSTESRLDRAGWAAFLNSCRGTVATEAGSWYLERDDATIRRIMEWQAEHLQERRGLVIGFESPLRRIGHRLPWTVKERLRGVLRRGPIRDEASVIEEVDPEVLHGLFFADAARPGVYSKAISSRHFDAVGTKTCQILMQGRYNDVLVADEHYIALEPDFGNIADVMMRFADDRYLQSMVDRTYEYVMDSHTHAHRLARLRALVD